MEKLELINYLNTYLEINKYTDKSKNWLQVDSSKTKIKKIGYSVDATSYIFDKAKIEWVDLVFCHHGLFWGSESVIIWSYYEKIKKLIHTNIALYACHIPLDAHLEVWNNIWLLNGFISVFWLKEWEFSIEDFWKYGEKYIGFWLRFKQKIKITKIQSLFFNFFQLDWKIYNFANLEFIQSIAFVSWAAWSFSSEAKEKWFDLFLTWEASHGEIINAKEMWQSLLLWGHRETEKIWPKLLAIHLKEKFWLEIVFLDEKY